MSRRGRSAKASAERHRYGCDAKQRAAGARSGVPFASDTECRPDPGIRTGSLPSRGRARGPLKGCSGSLLSAHPRKSCPDKIFPGELRRSASRPSGVMGYSVWSASMGSSEAARRAGDTPESKPVAKLIATARNAQSAGV